jgi:lipopolysaccharide export system permease protein
MVSTARSGASGRARLLRTTSNAKLRPVRILSRYVLSRFLFWFGACFALLCGIAASADLLIEFERVRELGGEGVQPIIYLLMRLPAMHFGYLIPIAAFAAALFTLGSAALGLEVIAAKAGGVSPHRLMLPVLAAAGVLTALTFVVNDTLVVRATHYVQRPEDGEAPDIVFRGGSFWYHRGRTIYNIRRADAVTGTLYGVSVYERDLRNRLIRSVHADRASIEGPDAWRFHDAIVRQFDPDRPAESAGFERTAEIVLTVADDPDLGILEADPAMLSTTDLRRYILAREREGENTRLFRGILQERLAAPLSVFLFALLAVPSAFRAERSRSLGAPALQGVMLLVAFWFMDGIASMISSRGLAYAEWAPWCVVALFLSVGLLRLRAVPA